MAEDHEVEEDSLGGAAGEAGRGGETSPLQEQQQDQQQEQQQQPAAARVEDNDSKAELTPEAAQAEPAQAMDQSALDDAGPAEGLAEDAEAEPVEKATIVVAGLGDEAPPDSHVDEKKEEEEEEEDKEAIEAPAPAVDENEAVNADSQLVQEAGPEAPVDATPSADETQVETPPPPRVEENGEKEEEAPLEAAPAVSKETPAAATPAADKEKPKEVAASIVDEPLIESAPSEGGPPTSAALDEAAIAESASAKAVLAPGPQATEKVDLESGRRPSIVSTTELATSPGGTKTMEVGLREVRRKSRQSKPAEAAPVVSMKERLQAEEPSAIPGPGATEEDAFGWLAEPEGQPEEAQADDVLAVQLERDMEQAMAMEELETIQIQPSARENIGDHDEPHRDVLSGRAPDDVEAVAITGQGDSMLRSLLQQKDEQIEALQSQLMQALRGDAGVVSAVSADAGVDKRDSKIVALAKKCRNLNLALERERERSGKLTRELDRAKASRAHNKASAALEREKPARGGAASSEEPAAARETAQAWQEKVAESQQRAEEMRRRADKAIGEAKRLKRALAREIGEGPVLDKLLKDIKHSAASAGAAQGGHEDAGLGSWRGRAQKIVLLQSKLKRAQAMLEQYGRMDDREGRSQPSVDPAMEQADSGFASPMPSIRSSGGGGGGGRRRRDVDAKAESDIRYIEQERRHAMEKLAEEYEGLEAQLGDSKRVMGAMRARANVLESENKRYKEQLKLLLSKTKNDDALVDALRRELERVKRDGSEHRARAKMLETGSTSTAAYEELQRLAQNQSAQIERQGELLVRMRAELERVKASASRELVDKANEDLDVQTQLVNSKLLRVENERLGELVELFKEKLERAVRDKETTMTKCKTLERHKIELERKLGNIRNGGRKRQPSADQFSELRDQVALQAEENRALRNSSRQALAQKDEEIKILREMGAEIKSAYERAIQEMRRQVASTAVEAQRRITDSETRVDDALLSQLTRDNEFLRGELSNLRHRSTGVMSPAHSRSMGSLESPQLRNRTVRRQQHQHQHQQPMII